MYTYTYRELIINRIPVYVRFICTHVYARFCYVLLDMCEPYVRLICAFFTNSLFLCFPLFPREAPRLPTGSLQEAPGEPQRAPGQSTYQRHMCLLPWGAASGASRGPPLGASRGPPLGASRGDPLSREGKTSQKIKKKCKKNIIYVYNTSGGHSPK